MDLRKLTRVKGRPEMINPSMIDIPLVLVSSPPNLVDLVTHPGMHLE